MHKKISKLEREDKSNGMIFFFLSREVSYIHSERLITIIYFMLCSYFQNNECKNLEIREGRQEQWNSTSTPWIFFFLSREVSYIHSERFLTFIFFMLCSYFQNNECKKSRNSRGRQEEWNPTSTTWYFFFFHENFHTYFVNVI